MSGDEKIELISEIHRIFYKNAITFEGIAGGFLSYLYPAIAEDEKCQLWGSNYDDMIIYLFLQNNFNSNHKIWEFIECEEIELFVVDAICHTTWYINWEFMLETTCKYNVVTRTCYDFDIDIFDGNGELMANWIIFELKPNDLFGDALLFRVDNPQKICDICRNIYSQCTCKSEENE